jgi:hypothetical protein
MQAFIGLQVKHKHVRLCGLHGEHGKRRLFELDDDLGLFFIKTID